MTQRVIVRKAKAGLEPTKSPTLIDIAWAAGIYEGEGSCVSGGRERKSYSIQVSQKDPELLYRLRELFGGAVKLYNVGKDRRFEVYCWQLCGDKGRVFVAAIYPHLTSRRKAQIDSTSVKVFLDYASDLITETMSENVSQRFESLCDRVAEFTSHHRAENDKKRFEYLKLYYQSEEYKAKQRTKAVQRRKIQKEKLEAKSLNIVKIA